ncbi:MAG: SH3 domain-containing protein [Bradyrhizobium sp.]|uniref:SH3 domain-containing protein n=1 Tax=Bradyrhizobium sp. TaxID=376 RepID=UPI001C283869|nr:SH3 domain-containing protein [Bradyrhizobium sp.]MBU6462503.1 SH3 domain-containing protein [Pseudomonadota bacterium]MDE2068052.1 SH3 domain-containing protein [Bradyrhizobium sp.]MDE2242176.1 SH3 domain-containing protein [Bradyrhizobium sp.]MDE2467448.1 SH3 domain-containing protein [Bradyrhizobium sp.]
MSFARIATSVAIFTLLSATGATAKPIAVSTDTNLRKSAGTDSDVLTLIPKGTTVEIGKCNNGWCEASLNGKDGFVIARNVGMAPARRPPPRRRPAVVEGEIVDEPPVVYGPPRAYIVPPPVYYGYGYGPYYGYGWGYRGWGWGWGRRW